MVRMACVNIPRLRLQLLVRRYPEWMEQPVAVVTEDKPLGTITAINRRARSAGVVIGMRYAAALSVEPLLRAAPVSDTEVAEAQEEIGEILIGQSPEIERFPLQAGIFWVNAAGFDRLYPSLYNWIDGVQKELTRAGFISRICIGFTRFGSFIATKRAKLPRIFLTEREEAEFSHGAPLSLLPMTSKDSLRLRDLGIDTIGLFIKLPTAGVKRRFSKEVVDWHSFALGASALPLQPERKRESLLLHRRTQSGVSDLPGVMLCIKEMLDHLLADVMKHNELLHTLFLGLVFEDGDQRTEPIRPARPTVQYDTISRLIWLRLESLLFRSPVTDITLSAQRVATRLVQQQLFQDQNERDPAQGAEAFALIRAELGNDAIQTASLRAEHLPERQFEWKSIHAPTRAAATGPTAPREADPWPAGEADRLIRSILRRPRPFLQTSVPETRRAGPYRVSSGWWQQGFDRDYFYLETRDGSIHWVYFDAARKHWMVQGNV